MSGRDYVNPEQLKLFMSANEITSSHTPIDGDRWDTVRGGESDEQVWKRKYVEAGASGLGRDIMQEGGVRDPVTLSLDERSEITGKPSVLGGHHRIAVMRQNKPDELMPVIYYEDHEDLVESHMQYNPSDQPYPYT